MTSQKNNLDVSSNQDSLLMSSITFDDFIAQYEPLINKLTHKYFLENHTKDDIKQIILMVMYRVWQTYDADKGSVIHYIYKSLGFEMSNKIRKKNHEVVNIIEGTEFDLDRRHIFKSSDDVEANVYSKDFEDRLWAFIDTLKFAKTMRYYYIGKMTLERVGEVQGITNQAVMGRLKKTHKEIKEHFGDEIYKYLENL